MKNFMVITLGTSDVQIKSDLVKESDFEVDGSILRHKLNQLPSINLRKNRDREDSRLLNQCRIDGELMVQGGIDNYLPVLDFPLTLPAINKFINDNPEHRIDKWLFVFTNQEDPNHRHNDTLFVRQILARKIEKLYGASSIDFLDFSVTEKIPDIDHQYVQFGIKCHSFLNIPESEVGQVILLAQGGIDQINQALTLQLTQAFKHKLRLYQKAEDRAPTLLTFPRLFLNDLSKQKILKHLDDYDFGLIDKLLAGENKMAYHLAQYASKRLSLQYDTLKINTDLIIGVSSENMRSVILSFRDAPSTRLNDLYIATKIQFRQRQYSDFLWRLFTIGENIFKIQVDSVVGPTEKYRLSNRQLKNKNGINEGWHNCLNAIDDNLIKQLSTTRNYKGYLIETDNPNRWSYQALYFILVNLNKIEHNQDIVSIYETVGNAIEELASSRNDIAHKLGSISIAEINQTLSDYSKEYSAKSLMANLDQLFNITGFGIFDTIQAEIKKLL